MKKYFFLTLITVVIATMTLSAQENRGGRGGDYQERMMNELKSAIPDLTQVQTDSIASFMKAQRATMQKERAQYRDGASGNFDPEAMKASMEKREKEQSAKFKSILNDEQYKAYEKWREESRKNRPMMPGNRPQGGR